MNDCTQFVSSCRQTSNYFLIKDAVIYHLILLISFKLDQQTVGINHWNVVWQIVLNDGLDSIGDSDNVVLTDSDQLQYNGERRIVQCHAVPIALYGTTQGFLRNGGGVDTEQRGC